MLFEIRLVTYKDETNMIVFKIFRLFWTQPWLMRLHSLNK